MACTAAAASRAPARSETQRVLIHSALPVLIVK